MEKFIVKGDPPIPSTEKSVVQIMFVDIHCFSLLLAVQGQVPRYCTPPKGPRSPPEQPGCALPQARHRLLGRVAIPLWEGDRGQNKNNIKKNRVIMRSHAGLIIRH